MQTGCSGERQTVAQTDARLAAAAVTRAQKTVRIRPKDGKGRLFIAELRVLGEGDAGLGSNGRRRLKGGSSGAGGAPDD